MFARAQSSLGHKQIKGVTALCLPVRVCSDALMLPALAKRVAAVLSALLLLSVQSTHGTQQPEFNKSLRLPDGTDVHFASVHGVPRWRLLPYLWFDKTVRVSCAGRKACPLHCQCCMRGAACIACLCDSLQSNTDAPESTSCAHCLRRAPTSAAALWNGASFVCMAHKQALAARHVETKAR